MQRDPAAPISRRASAQLREEQRDLAGSGLVGVRAVDDVVLHLEGEVAADGAGGGLDRVGGAGQRAERLDRPRALDDEREQRAAGDELDQRAEERLLAVLAVVLLGDVAGQGAQLGGDQPQALGLQARDHLADQATGDAVGLDEDQGAFCGGFGHERGAYAAGSPSPRGAGSRKGWPSSSLRICSRYSQISTNTPPTNHMALVSRPVSSSGTCSAVATTRPWGRRCTPLASTRTTASTSSSVSRTPPRPSAVCAMPRGTNSTAMPLSTSTPAAAPRSARAARTGSGAVTACSRSSGCGPPPR